jgi:hypothetical protein
MSVAFAATAASGNDNALAGSGQIADQFAGSRVLNNSSNRDVDHPIIAALPVAVATHAVLAASRLVLFLITQIEQGRELRIGDHDDIAARPAVAAVRSAARHILLPPKTHAPTPAVTGENADLSFIDKLHERRFLLLRFFYHLPTPGKKKAP